MIKIFLTFLLGLVLCTGFGFLLREKSSIDCYTINTALLVQTPRQTLGFPRAAFTKQISEKACNIDNQYQLLWNPWRIDIEALIIDVALWFAAAAILVYGVFITNHRLLRKHTRRT